MKQHINKAKLIKINEKEILGLIKVAESMNQYYKDNLKSFDTNYLITPKDIKFFQFVFLYFSKSQKYKDIHAFFLFQNKKIICNKNSNNSQINKTKIESIKHIIAKFINFCLINRTQLAKNINKSLSGFTENILKIIKILFLNDFINEKDMQMILFIQVILCLYKDKEKSINIQNENQLYDVINYLLSFCSYNSYNMKDKKKEQFNLIIKYIIELINNHILVNMNYTNKYLLSRNKSFYKLIGLTKITSDNNNSKIIRTLVQVYMYHLNIDYVFDDLSEQFLYRTKKESILNKTNLLIAKNNFVNDLLEKEKLFLKKEDIFIKNGFYFCDCPNNGIECNSINKFPNENDGYSIVVSFRLMNNTNNTTSTEKDLSKYTIFSIMNKDNNLMHLYIEEDALKLRIKKEKKSLELFKIKKNTNYVLWQIQSKTKKHKMIFYLNNNKNVINNVYYPEGYFTINLGFNNCNNPNYTSKDNFIGIIGTFFLFKKCLIKDENDNINITKLTELKGNYEDIIYVNSKREWGFIDKNINWILNKLANDIDINKDIEIIISSKSLGNLKLLFDSSNILGELKPEIYCNYFKNSSKNDVKFSFRNIKTLENNLNFPIEFPLTFINVLNSHIFLYLQLELYYFISLLSSRLSEIKEDKDKNPKNFQLFENSLEEEDFYLNISKICSLFFVCLDSLNNITCLNSAQEKMIQKEVDNFKYTLIDLVSIYSKYGCKIKTYFLSLFVEKISEKKYFEHCLFILTFEFYDINNNEVFNILFNYLNHISIELCDNNQVKQLFIKLIDFDKIYLSPEIQKTTKKEYSKLIRALMKASIDAQIFECSSHFRKKLKNLKKSLEKNNMFKSISNIQEEEDINENEKKQFKTSFCETNNINNKDDINLKQNSKSRKMSINKREKEKDLEKNSNDNDESNYCEDNLNILILIYKYLKNLYISINDIKKKYVEACQDKINSISDFFNDLYNSLCEIYPIEEDEQYLKFQSSEKDKKEIIYAELIKCLCIRFLDDLFFEENLKLIKDQEAKNLKNNDKDSNKGSSGGLKRSFHSYQFTSKTNISRASSKKGSLIKDGSSNNLLSLNQSQRSSFISNNVTNNNTIEGILTRKMEFFQRIILTQYTFKSFYLMLFREIPNDKKIKFIKDDKNIKSPFLLSEKNFPKTRYLLRVIISLFEKQNSDGYDTLFMSKIQMIEYYYNTFINLLKNVLDNYLKSEGEKKKKLKPMINNIFVDKKNYYNVHRFYRIMIDNNICNFNFIGCTENKQNFDLIKDYLDKLLIQVQHDIIEFINNTLFELIDPFYFNLLIEIYYENDMNNEFIINTVIIIMEKIITKMDKNKNRIIEINSKNILILLYKMIFYIHKRYFLISQENELFLKKILFFLSHFIEDCNILYTKILFPIEESRGKLLIEILYEIILELHIESLRNPNLHSLQVSENLLKGLFDEKNMKKNLNGHIKHKKSSKDNEEIQNETYSPFYMMDKLSFFIVAGDANENLRISEDIYINRQFFDLKDYIFSKYKDEIDESKDLFSVSILFCIKIILSINELEEFHKNYIKNNNLSKSSSTNSETNIESENNENINKIKEKEPKKDEFLIEIKTQFENLCKNILKIHVEHISSNPFKSIGYYARNIYEYFRAFIVDQFSFAEGDSNNKVEELIKNLGKYKSDIKYFERVIYTEDGRTKLYTEKTFNQILKSLKNESTIIKDNESVGSLNDKVSRHSSEGFNLLPYNQSLKGSSVGNNDNLPIVSSVKSVKKLTGFINTESSKSQNYILQKKNFLNKSIYNNNNNNKYIYFPSLKFIKDLIRLYFSSYFKKLLSYDEDFINIKNIYILTYNKEIKDIDKYGILFPTRLKNYITNNFNKVFLKRDFDFFTDGFFQYSHSYLYNKKNKYNYVFQNKLLFPQKKLLEENDSAHKDIPLLNDLIIYECEMITVKGSIFGNLYVFENCLLFRSELKNDKRIKDSNLKNENEDINYLDYACCTAEFDHIKKEKRIILEYDNIKEVVNRTFFFSWISLEIFLKDGRSFLFNLFNEETNDDLLEFLKQKKIQVIRKISEYFKKEEFSKKWKEEKITTFDYLFLLNKFSSRTYNDPNQYPIMPWIFLEQGLDFIRDFDLPISVQDKDKQDQFLSKTENYIAEDNSISHGNHYSTSAYILFYLMRANPFTNNMIKFQSNCFDIADRQYSDINQTIFLCQKMSNNREMIPELFSIPESYINLNDNDFGKQKDGVRVHNISFQPYCENQIQFSYLLKDLINNNIEINNQINKWFDFIFGVNQLGNYSNNKNLSKEEKDKLKCLRKFNSYCYGQFNNLKKIMSEKQNKTNSKLYDDIKLNINIAINFGQCPFQLLNEPHPIKNKNIISDNCSIYSTHSSENINIVDNSIKARFNSSLSNHSIKENKNNFMTNKKIADIYKIKGNGEIIYFSKSSNNNFLYCLLSNRIFEIYKYDNKKNSFVSIKEIIAKCQFLFLKRTKNQELIFRPKYLFCEFNENTFICCRTLDKTLIYYNYSEDIETSFVLKSYTTCILYINNNEFISGHDNGHLCKWKINYSSKEKKVELELIQLIKSNKNSITCLAYNEKINIVISCDINTIMIRKNYDFEYFHSINIENEENIKKFIVDVKISDYNFLYALIHVEEKNSYELQGFTMNGTYFGKYSGNISNFEISQSGKIIIGDLNKPIIKILDPANLTEIFSKTLDEKGENCFYHFYFEKPNIIYYGVRDKDSTRIKITFLDTDDDKYFT